MSVTYKIGEAAALLNLKTYVLRFWETEFPQINPLRTEKGQRLYTEGHLALLDRIRFLLHERGLTIEGTRKVLAEEALRGVRYIRAHGQDRDENIAGGIPAGYESSAETPCESGSSGSEGEYSEILSHANAPALPGYGLAPASQPPGNTVDAPVLQRPDTANPPIPQPSGANATPPMPAYGEAPPAPALQMKSSGLTSAEDRGKDIAIGLGIGFETMGGKRKTDASHGMEQGMLIQADTVAAVEGGFPDAASGNALKETGDTVPAGRGRALAPAPHSDWDDIKNAFNAEPEDDGWDLIQSGAAPDGQEKAGTDAHNAIKEIAAELEAVAELLRGPTAGISS